MSLGSLWAKSPFLALSGFVDIPLQKLILHSSVIERLGIEDDKVRKNVETVLSTHDNLLRSVSQPQPTFNHSMPLLVIIHCKLQLPRTSRHLEENDWERLKPDLDKYLEAYTSWVESNPLCRYPELGHVVSSRSTSPLRPQ